MSAPDERTVPFDGAPDDPGHPERALAADYALDLLAAGERVLYEAHLAGCAHCRAETRAYAETAALLAHAAPAAEPPAGLRARILAEARSAEVHRPQLVRDPPGADRRAPRGSVGAAGYGTGRAPWLAAAAALVLAVGLGAGWARERRARGEAEQALGARAAELTAAVRAELAGEVVARNQLVAERDSLLATLAEPDVRTMRLAADGELMGARLVWSRRRGLLVVAAAALPAPGTGRTYQLWGIPRGGTPRSLGTFAPTADGSICAVMRVPPAGAMAVAAVTEEPMGGSPQPTTTPFLVGEIGAE